MDNRIPEADKHGVKFRDEHQKWFIDFYRKGFENARARLKYNSEELQKHPGYRQLDATQITQIDEMAKGNFDGEGVKVCKGDFAYLS
jgi:hypothetical protein